MGGPRSGPGVKTFNNSSRSGNGRNYNMMRDSSPFYILQTDWSPEEISMQDTARDTREPSKRTSVYPARLHAIVIGYLLYSIPWRQ